MIEGKPFYFCRNLPLSIAIGMLITTFFYLLANLAYFAVLTPLEMLESTAVAVTFAEKSLGGFAVVMPLFVALLRLRCNEWTSNQRSCNSSCYVANYRLIAAK